jgi:hypothetical protein
MISPVPADSSDPKIHKRPQMNTFARGVWPGIKSFVKSIVQRRPNEICFRVPKQLIGYLTALGTWFIPIVSAYNDHNVSA